MENNFILDTNVILNLTNFDDEIRNKNFNTLRDTAKQNASEAITAKIKMLKSMKNELVSPITPHRVNDQNIKGVKDFFEKYKDNNLIKNLDNIDLSKEPFKNNDYQKILNNFNVDANKISYVELNNCHSHFCGFFKSTGRIFANLTEPIRTIKLTELRFLKDEYMNNHSTFINANENVKTLMIVNEIIKDEKQFFITPTILEEVENHIDNADNSWMRSDKLYDETKIREVLKNLNFINTENGKFQAYVDELQDNLKENKAVTEKENVVNKPADATIAAESNILGINLLTYNAKDFTIDKSITNASGQGYGERKMKMINVLINHTDYTTNALPCSVDEFFKSRGIIERKPIRVIAMRNEEGNYEILENSADEKFPNTKEIVLKNESNFERVKVNEKQISTQRNSFEFKNAYKLKNKQENEIEREM